MWRYKIQKIYRFSQFEYHNCHDENWCDRLDKMRWGFFSSKRTDTSMLPNLIELMDRKKETIYFNWAWLDLNANDIVTACVIIFFFSERNVFVFHRTISKKNIFEFNDSIVSDNCLSTRWEAVSSAQKVSDVYLQIVFEETLYVSMKNKWPSTEMQLRCCVKFIFFIMWNATGFAKNRLAKSRR